MTEAVKTMLEIDKKSSSYRKLTLNPEEEHDRGHWGSKTEFMLSCIGLSVGLGNLWRFPTLAFENGGAAFFIPYIILQMLIGKPMYFMELALGQYSGYGPVGIYRCNPGAKGIGVSMALVCIVIAIYYNAIMAYTLYFMFISMQSVLPWTTCKDEWISKNCYERFGKGKSMPLCGSNVTSNLTDLCKCSNKVDIDFNFDACEAANSTMNYNELLTLTKECPLFHICENVTRTPASFYFYDEVIKRVDGVTLSNVGSPIWFLALCLLLSWVFVVLCLLKGVKSSGKVVYFTATFPYVVIIALVIRGATLDGAIIGIKYFLIPEWSKLLDIQVWVAAGGQMFFSLSVAMGAIITLGSYNQFRNNIYIDALIISTADILTSFISGMVVFSTLGNMAYQLDVNIKDVASSGYGLAFVAYPESLSQLPAPQFWSVIFFFMLFTLGVDSEFALVETALTSLMDEFPRLLKYKTIITLGSGAIGFLLALPITTPGGDYILTLMDSYGAVFTLYIICLAEGIAISWVYGARKFMKDIEFMIGYHPHPVWFWYGTWKFVAPTLVFVIFIIGLAFYKPPTYANKEPFGAAAQVGGWLLFLVVFCPIPILFIKNMYYAPGTFMQRLKHVSTPTKHWTKNADAYSALDLSKVPESGKPSSFKTINKPPKENAIEPARETSPINDEPVIVPLS